MTNRKLKHISEFLQPYENTRYFLMPELEYQYVAADNRQAL